MIIIELTVIVAIITRFFHGGYNEIFTTLTLRSSIMFCLCHSVVKMTITKNIELSVISFILKNYISFSGYINAYDRTQAAGAKYLVYEYQTFVVLVQLACDLCSNIPLKYKIANNLFNWVAYTAMISYSIGFHNVPGAHFVQLSFVSIF